MLLGVRRGQQVRCCADRTVIVSTMLSIMLAVPAFARIMMPSLFSASAASAGSPSSYSTSDLASVVVEFTVMMLEVPVGSTAGS